MNDAPPVYKILFDQPRRFEPMEIKSLLGVVGLYFIFNEEMKIQYPFKQSRLLYIGMSEKKTNSIGSRLVSHLEGKSGNWGLVNYGKVQTLYFTYINFEMLRGFWDQRVEDLESYFILDFVRSYGVYPICNNKSGYEIEAKDLKSRFLIDWEYFD